MAVAYWKLARLQRIENHVYRVGCEKDSFVSTLHEYLSSDDETDDELA
jgi:Ser/Thr protein kinase RdoA (MazF antagonist)